MNYRMMITAKMDLN